ncbi:hypothetical protein PMAYCL1PPCAC_31741, partial [Pristionchus mayeri]
GDLDKLARSYIIRTIYYKLKSDRYQRVTDVIQGVSSRRMIVDIPNNGHGRLSPAQIEQFANGRSHVHFCNGTPGVDDTTLRNLWGGAEVGQVGQGGPASNLQSVYFNGVSMGRKHR